MTDIQTRVIRFLRWSEKYTRTDMVYLVGSGFWMNTGSWIISGFSFLLYIIFGHFVPKDVYGIYQFLLSMSVIVSALTLSGMNIAVTRAVVRGNEGALIQSVLMQLRWAFLPLVFAWIAAGYYFLQGNSGFGWGFLLIGAFVPFNNTLNTYNAYLNAKKDFRRAFLFNILANIPYYLGLAFVALIFKSAIILLIANLLTQSVGLLIVYYKTISIYSPNTRGDDEAMQYGKHMSVMNFFGTVVSQVDSVLTFHFLGPVSLGLYGFATAIPDRLSIFKNLTNAAFPKFATKTHDELRDSLGKRIFIGMAVALVIAGAYSLIAPFFFRIFFPVYIGSVNYSRLYSLILVGTFGSLFTTALMAEGRVRDLYRYNLIVPLVQLVLIVVGIFGWGLWGLVAARVIAAFFASIFAWFLFALPGKNVRS